MAAGRQAYIQSDPCSAKLPVVQAGLIRPLLSYAENRGADTQALLHAAHLPVDLMVQPQHFVPAARWFDLFSKLVRLSGQPDLGWRVATDSGLSAYSREFMAGISNAPTLLEAWRFVARAQSRHCNCQFFTVRVIGEFGYVMQGDTCLYPGYEQRNAFRTANTIAVARAFLGDDWRPDLIVTQTSFDALPIDNLAGTRIVRRRNYSAVRIPRGQLIAPPKQQLNGTYASGGGTPSDTPDQIRHVLRSYSRADRPSLQEIAALMNTSHRSLQRRLRDQHTSYAQLVKEASFERARELLTDPGLTVTDIAHHLGYNDSSHFSRMFRGVCGVCPREYRAGLNDGEFPAPLAQLTTLH